MVGRDKASKNKERVENSLLEVNGNYARLAEIRLSVVETKKIQEEEELAAKRAEAKLRQQLLKYELAIKKQELKNLLGGVSPRSSQE